ncbi:MAG: hypothetical protein HN350_10905 [Phycisphaerales bacterium]|jgi:hypothetical protein|nr:hypothetical protein [Phycisphaerales bacterium]
MKKLLSTFAALALVAALCTGCQKTTPTEDNDGDGHNDKTPTTQKADPAELKVPDAVEDHTGHNHAPGEGHDH